MTASVLIMKYPCRCATTWWRFCPWGRRRPMSRGGGCPPSIRRCYDALIKLAVMDGVAAAVTGSDEPLLLPPLGMVSLYGEPAVSILDSVHSD
eukprot:SAG25_NODE_2077_length_1979_cov_1.563298_2_plen_93_part_00